MALAGDATGYFHPLSAAGLTLAFADAQCLARSGSVAAYRRERTARTHTTEMLATALYGVLADSGPAGQEIRKSIYETWRRSPRQRQRTMSLLSTAEHRRWQLWLPFLSAIGHTVRRNLGPVLWRNPAKSRAIWRGSILWLRWLVVSTFRRAQPIPVPIERQGEARNEGIYEDQRV
jgi:flavin-dependent dehydrogenase